MKISKRSLLPLTMLALMLTVPAAFGQSPQPPTNSAQSLPNSATRAIDACAAAANELEKSRVLIAALEDENRALRERLKTARQTAALLTELNETRQQEIAALSETVAAKNETIAAKDAVIASQAELNKTLKKKKPSLLKRIGDVLLGAAVIAVLK